MASEADEANPVNERSHHALLARNRSALLAIRERALAAISRRGHNGRRAERPKLTV